MSQAEIITLMMRIKRPLTVRVVDLRKRHGVKQRSFSLSVSEGTNDNEYESADELKSFLENTVKRKRYV